MSKIKVDQIESVDGVADITLNNDLASLSVTGASTLTGNVTINKDTPSLYLDATANNQNIWFRNNGTNTFGIEVQPSATGGVYLSNRTEGGTYNIRTTPSGGSLTNQVVIGASGHIMANSGIVLGNGTSYSASNLLDDYEEGTWNPALQTGIPGSPAAVVNSANCRYVKIGGFVQASAYFQAANDGTNIQIGGLPFASSKYSSFSLGHQNKTVSFERMDNGNTHVNFTLSGTNASLQEWYFSIQYYTTS